MTDNNKWSIDLVQNKLAEEKFEKFELQKIAVGNRRQDLSRQPLEKLLDRGYTIVQWDSGVSTHAPCVELNNQQWTLADFVSGLEHDAPIFEKSHPGDVNCSVLVKGENLPTLRVDSFGNVDEEEPGLVEEPALEEVPETEVEELVRKPKRKPKKEKQPKVPPHGFEPGTEVKLKPEYGLEWEKDQTYEVLPDEVDEENVLLMDEEGEIFRVHPEQIERV